MIDLLFHRSLITQLICSKRSSIILRHKAYCQIDEHVRLIEIQQALDNKPLKVIRFNPDSFNDNDNSLFEIIDREVCIKNQFEYDTAISELIECIHDMWNICILEQIMETCSRLQNTFWNKS